MVRKLLLVDAITRHTGQTGSRDLAIQDIEKATRRGDLDLTRRNEETGEEEPVPPAFLEGNQIVCVDLERPVKGPHVWIYRRREQRWGAWNPQDRIDGYIYYVSQFQFERLWFPAEAEEEPELPQASEQIKPTPKRKPGGGSKQLLSDEQIERSKAYCNRKLDEDPAWYDRLGAQGSALDVIAVELKELRRESWQTVKKRIVDPVLKERRERGLIDQ
jgi:hypothetical protein